MPSIASRHPYFCSLLLFALNRDSKGNRRGGAKLEEAEDESVDSEIIVMEEKADTGIAIQLSEGAIAVLNESDKTMLFGSERHIGNVEAIVSDVLAQVG